MASLECRAVYEKESVVRGHHVYKAIWTPVIGEELEVRTEDDNDHDQHAVAVVKDGRKIDGLQLKRNVVRLASSLDNSSSHGIGRVHVRVGGALN